MDDPLLLIKPRSTWMPPKYDLKELGLIQNTELRNILSTSTPSHIEVPEMVHVSFMFYLTRELTINLFL